MKIDLYGDSTQAASGMNTTPAQMLQMKLNAVYGPGVHTVTNFGIGGATIADALSSPTHFAAGNIAQHIATRNADIIVGNWGINDGFIPGNNPGNHLNNYCALRNHVMSLGKKFVYQSPNPIKGSSDPHNQCIGALDAAVKTIPGLIVADIRNDIYSNFTYWPDQLSDTIHPKQSLCLFVGLYLYFALAPHL